MKYLSLCSGIEAATVAWHPLGWEAVAYSEIERFPSEVLAHHYPSTPNLGDMTKFKEWNFESDVDLLVGGTPCQSFSVAGLRKGLDDPRGNLMLTFGAIAAKYRPKWLVWENVPGVLSSNGGRDFGAFLGMLGQLGYGFAYRVLDAQYFGVAQRRRRVFVVGYLGDWRPAAAVLFESHSLQGHPAPRREKGQAIAPSVTTGPPFSRTGNDRVECEAMVVWPAQVAARMVAFGEYSDDDTASSLKARDYKDATDLIAQPAYGIPGNWIGRKPENGGNATEPMHDVAPCLTKTDQHGVAQPVAYAFDSLSSNSMKSTNPISGCNEVDVSKALDTSRGLDPSCNQGGMAVAQPICLMDQGGSVMNIEHDMTGTLRRETHGHEPLVMQAVAFSAGNSSESRSIGYTVEGTPPLRAGASGTNQVPTLMQAMAVRRLTPVECERLQGFPDSYTDIKSKNKPTPDGPRYKALGNSMAVPVMAWIGQRIQEVEAICKQNK